MPAPAANPLAIRSLRRFLVRVPVRTPIVWGSGVRTGVTRLLVELTTEGGVVGWGETICLLDAIPAVLDKVVMPLAVGRGVDEVERLHRHVLGAGYYHHKRAAVMAMCAVEMAMWDAFGKISGQPLFRLWGGLWRERIPLAAYLLQSDPAIVAEDARAYLAQGYETFKLKIGYDERSDVELTRIVRAVIGPDRPLRLDVNGAWTPGTAKRQLQRLLPHDPAYVEQPLELDDLAGHAALRASQSVPIALDESAYTLQDVGNIVRAQAADVILLDPHEAGGLWQTVKAAAIAESVGIPVTLHSGGELALSQAAYLHLAASIPNMTLAIDNELQHLAGDVTARPFVIDRGALAVPQAPGLGVEVDLDLVRKHEVNDITGAYLDPRRPGWFPVKPAY
ncbi:MAG: mandelate racemase/muconate lactonizing enzyme family protein [Betaproteobacteria bacterium]|jgi:L-rhamnonate dehydratase|nr:mandelate racemase/muconate lactonizing enzyme family protein [Betaproteobacteria bacterium]